MANKPVHQLRCGQITCSIWENEVKGKNGTYMKKSVSFQKSYNVDGEWKTTQSFSVDDVVKFFPLFAVELAKYCYMKDEPDLDV